MADDKLESFFERFLRKEGVFLDKKTLQSAYIPETILYREEQIKQIANIIATVLRGDKPSNIFIYGKTGTGKTLTVKYTTQKLIDIAKNKNIPFKVIYVNCKLKRSADTEYRLIAHLSAELGKTIPPTGLPTDEIYNIFYKAVENQKI